jgi:formiminotetrahydrofolate cyclodeaminase
MPSEVLYRSLVGLADDVAANEAGVGAGVVALGTAGLAAALVGMVAAASEDAWADARRTAQRANDLKAQIIQLADAEAGAYADARHALHPDEGPMGDGEIGDALKETLAVLLEAASLAAQVAELAADTALHGDPDRRADAAAAAALAAGSARALAVLVQVNLVVTEDDPRVEQAERHVGGSRAAADRAQRALG